MKRKCHLLERYSEVMGLGFLTECYVDGVKSTIMDGCPLLKQLVERVGNHPRWRNGMLCTRTHIIESIETIPWQHPAKSCKAQHFCPGPWLIEGSLKAPRQF